jgi:predicted site-specific integrase-resolvase
MKDKEFLTLVEAAQYVGVKRATLYNYMKGLRVEAVPMGPDGRKRYIALADAKKMKAYKEQPWTVEKVTND